MTSSVGDIDVQQCCFLREEGGRSEERVLFSHLDKVLWGGSDTQRNFSVNRPRDDFSSANGVTSKRFCTSSG